jgi:hypothetical protein
MRMCDESIWELTAQGPEVLTGGSQGMAVLRAVAAASAGGSGDGGLSLKCPKVD